MKRNDEEYLYNWILDHKKLEFSNTNKNWLEILKNNFHGQKSEIKEKDHKDVSERENNSNEGCHNNREKNFDYEDIQFDGMNHTDDTLFGNIKCDTEDQSPGSSFTWIQKSLKCPLIFMNKTKEIAMSLGVEHDQSSISRISTMLTPATSNTANKLVKSDYVVTVERPSDTFEMSSPDQKLKKPVNFDANFSFETQGFKTDDILLPSNKNSLELPTPETRLNVFKKLPVNCTSTPVSHYRLSTDPASDAKGNMSKYREDSINSRQCNRIPGNCSASEAISTPRSNSEKHRFTVSRNILNSCEVGKSSSKDLNIQKNKTTVNKLSLSYMKKKKKFVYPVSEEKINEELAINEMKLIEKVTENVVENIKEEMKYEKGNISKQANFMSACTLPENGTDNQVKYFSLLEPKQIENKGELERQTCQEKSVENIDHDTLDKHCSTEEQEYYANNEVHLGKQSNCLKEAQSSIESKTDATLNKESIRILFEETYNSVEMENVISNTVDRSLHAIPLINSFTDINKEKVFGNTSFPGFQSALGKKIVVSSEELQKAKTLWEDVEDNSSLVNEKSIQDNKIFVVESENKKIISNANLDFQGFQSALGKKITVSTEALQKAKTLWEDVDDNSSSVNAESTQNNKKIVAESEKNEKSISNAILEFQGFQSALGKKITISTEALQKAKTIWKAVEEDSSLENERSTQVKKCIVESVNAELIPKTSMERNTDFPEFHSESGSKINKSIEAFTKAKANLSDDFDNDLFSFEPKIRKEQIGGALIRSRTSSDKPVSVNPSSLLNTKLFDEDLWDEVNKKIETRVEKSNYCQEICGNVSPILGSLKNRSRHSQKRCLSQEDLNTNAAKILKADNEDVKNLSSRSVSEPVPDSSRTKEAIPDAEENMDINEITEAFLLDTSWEDATMNLEDKHSTSLQPLSSSNIEERETLRRKQEEIIKLKMENKLKCKKDNEGILFQLKLKNKEKRIQLSSLTLAKTFLKEDMAALSITSKNCGEFRFEGKWENIAKVEFDDGLEVVPGKDNRIGWEEIESGFLSSMNVKCSIVPKSWIFHHYSLIVWKLASLQRRAGHHFQERIFSIEETMNQLRFRYDVEIMRGKRSILRKIYEQDDTPRRTMVLCVSNINVNGQIDNGYQKSAMTISSPLALTDGWYNIDTQIDDAMISLLQKHKIKIGSKLIIHGAELVGNPAPCHPLQMSSQTIQLKIYTNMCRLVAWHSRLGLKLKVGLLPSSPFSCILENGGTVGSIECVLCRKYPVAFMEKISDKTNIISERLCETRMRAVALKRDSMMERIYYQVEKEIVEEEEKRIKSSRNPSFRVDSLKDLCDGEKIVEYLNDSNDPSVLQALSAEQLRLAANCKEDKLLKRRHRITKEVNARAKSLKSLYEVVPLLKLGVIDKTGKEAVITIWRPQEELLSVQEGRTYSFHYLVPSASRNNIKQLTWSKQSFFRPSKSSSLKLGRNPISDFSSISSSFDDLPFREIDVVGVIIKILEAKDGGQNVCLCDQESNFICLRFSPSILELEFEDLVKRGNVISSSNCSLRSRRLGEIVTVNVTPFTIISSEIQKHFESTMINLKEKLKENPSFVANVENKLQEYFEICEAQAQDFQSDLQIGNGDKNGTFPSRLKAIANSSSPAVNRPFRTPLRSSKK